MKPETVKLLNDLKNCESINSLSHYKRDLIREARETIESMESVIEHYKNAYHEEHDARIEEIKKNKKKYGKWEYRYEPDDNSKPDFLAKRWYCSECGDWQTYGETRYCPSCGAKMEVKREP